MYNFRIMNGVFTPYLTMPFNLFHIETCYAIRSICIGPSYNQKLLKNGLEQYFNSLDYYLDECKIHFSNIPIRY